MSYGKAKVEGSLANDARVEVGNGSDDHGGHGPGVGKLATFSASAKTLQINGILVSVTTSNTYEAAGSALSAETFWGADHRQPGRGPGTSLGRREQLRQRRQPRKQGQLRQRQFGSPDRSGEARSYYGQVAVNAAGRVLCGSTLVQSASPWLKLAAPGM